MTISKTTAISAIFLFTTSPAWAYLDPGTGSMLLQGLAAGVAAGAGAITMFWTRIRALFGRSGTAQSDDETKSS